MAYMRSAHVNFKITLDNFYSLENTKKYPCIYFHVFNIFKIHIRKQGNILELTFYLI